jgi:predicted RNase H-like HicB family nuclease
MAKPAKSPGVHLKVVLEPSDDGGYTVTVPALPGCVSEGDSKEDALRNIREAIQVYLEDVPADSVHSERAVIEEIVV